MNSKILLKENKAAIAETLANQNTGYANGSILLQKLKNIGLELKSVSDWQKVEQHFKAQFPNATLDFNLEAQGISTPYYEAKEIFDRNRYLIRFNPVTDAEIEQIKEKYRVYTSTPKQVEVHNLVHGIIDNLNRLKELGINIDVSKAYLINPAFDGDWRDTPPMKVNTRELNSQIINLKA